MTDARWTHHHGVIPQEYVIAARRRLLLELRRVGVTAEDVAEWSVSGWWPSLRDEPVFGSVRDALWWACRPRGFTWAETQILIRLPDEEAVVGAGWGEPHVDTLPPWATSGVNYGHPLKYGRIYGVELTDTPPHGGGTVLHEPGEEPRYVRCLAGDVLSMAPDLPHSGSANGSGDVRMALFYRSLVPAD